MPSTQADPQTVRREGKDLGLGHEDHPLLGCEVIDHDHDGIRGVLRAYAPAVDKVTLVPSAPSGKPVAWLAPVKGGLEWTTDLNSIEPV
ncbi:hypothetical protein ACH4NT_34375 [Streptomyces lydicus]|uniref:hypothetical protein n=1 Tax=Streptomyces lydicus TaxID=47763 RepID=UPI0037A9614B